MSSPMLLGDVLASLVTPGGELDLEVIRDLMSDDHPDLGAIERATEALGARSRQAGDWWWGEGVCLQCQGITPAGSHLEHQVATYDEATRTSCCPDCGRTVHWGAEPGLRADPRCRLCRSGCRCPLCGDVARTPRPTNAMGDALCADCAGWTWPPENCPPTVKSGDALAAGGAHDSAG